MENFQNKVAIVTGGASGIGRALCEELAERGARVVAADLNLTAAQEVAADIIAAGSQARRVMVQQRFGHIVNIASLAGLTPIPLGAAYATTKHAVVGLSTSLRIEAADLGIKVSVGCPGLIRTPIYDTFISVTPIDREESRAKLSRVKMMAPDECARVILRGVARNKAIIPVTGMASLMWRLNRFNSAVLEPLNRKTVRDQRAMKV